MFKILILGLLAAASAAASTLYAFNFTGTITSGTAYGFNPSISNNTLTPFADLTGSQVSGTLWFDLGLAPAPAVTDNGFTSTTIQSMSAPPVFVSETFAIGGFTVPAGFFAMPTVFDLPGIPTVPGSTVTTSQSTQGLSLSTQDGGTAQSIIAQMNFMSSWSGATSGASDVALDILASGITPFFAIPPAGSLPATFGPETSGVNGTFLFFTLTQDPAVTANFGITSFWEVTGSFTLDSSSGGILTPEPDTLAISAIGLAALAAIKHLKTYRIFSRARNATRRALYFDGPVSDAIRSLVRDRRACD